MEKAEGRTRKWRVFQEQQEGRVGRNGKRGEKQWFKEATVVNAVEEGVARLSVWDKIRDYCKAFGGLWKLR